MECIAGRRRQLGMETPHGRRFTIKTACKAEVPKPSGLVRRRHSSTRTACMAVVHGRPRMAIRSIRHITMQTAYTEEPRRARLSATRRLPSTMARMACQLAGLSRRHSATRQQPGTTISTECRLGRRHRTTAPSGSRSGREVFKSAESKRRGLRREPLATISVV